MTLLEIFEKVNLIVPIEQRRFFNYYDDTVKELQALYGDSVFEEGAENFVPTELSEETAMLPLYHGGIVDNILFLSGQGDTYKSEFLRKAKDAYLKYWNENAKNRRVRRMRW